ncbi:MAG: sigma-70 family RNA polymerase sigma factor [Bacteroidales bacterium]|nr:sigma-70 family RNA polymerase sigma factor [Bacteroidales bacterium]
MNWSNDPDYKEAAQQAFIAICYRFREDVAKKCEVIANRKGLSCSDAIEIGENTFKRLYKYSDSFDPDRHEDCDKGLKYYLFKIAQNECTKLYCKRNGIGISPYTGDEEVITEFPDEIPENFEIGSIDRKQLEREREILELALKRHSWKHQVIYLTYKFHQIDGYRLPRKLLQELRDMLGLGQNTIIAYKKEINDTINDYIKIYGKHKK